MPDLAQSAGDRFFDYCLEPYRPRRPWQGKLRSESLLWRALALAGIEAAARPAIEALRASLGRDMTVFGVKHDGARFFFELYVYDPRKEDPAATVAGLTEALAAVLPIRVPVRESIPYMMVSFDLDAATLERGVIDELNLYLTGTKAHAAKQAPARASGMPRFPPILKRFAATLDVDSPIATGRSITRAASFTAIFGCMRPKVEICATRSAWRWCRR